MKILRSTLLVSLGLLAIVSGEADDLPGLQGLGLILIVAVLIFAYRGKRQA